MGVFVGMGVSVGMGVGVGVCVGVGVRVACKCMCVRVLCQLKHRKAPHAFKEWTVKCEVRNGCTAKAHGPDALKHAHTYSHTYTRTHTHPTPLHPHTQTQHPPTGISLPICT